MTTATPLHATGIIKAYVDRFGRTQQSVTGPRGHVLVTRNSKLEPYQVTHSDQTVSLGSSHDPGHALEIACNAVGIEL